MKNKRTVTTIKEAVENFLGYQKTNYPPRTHRNRGWSMAKFSRYLQNRGVETLCQLTPEVLRDYEREKPKLFTSLSPERDQVAPGTLRLDTSNLRMFLIYLHNRQLILEDLSATITPRRGRASISKSLPLKVIEEWFSICDLSIPTGLRDRAFFEVTYGAGLRPSESLALKLKDFDLADGRLLVRKSKNGEARMVPITRTSSHFVRKYLDEARDWLPRTPKTEEMLWLTTRGNAVTLKAMQDRVREHYRPRLSCGTPITLHRLRHSCATHLLKAGASVRHVQELLGHRSINSTQVYTKVAIPDLRSTFRRFHPRSHS
jgi:integrase/recombinase XerD